MAMTEWREYRGKPYLYIEHSGTETEVLDNLGRAMDLIRTRGGSSTLILANVEGGYGTAAVMEGLARFARDAKPYVARRAIIGVRGFKKALLGTYNRLTGQVAGTKATEQEALDYLFGV